MFRTKPLPLPIAVRVYPEWPREDLGLDHPDRRWRLPDSGLIFDTETRTDHVQRLTFGSYRFIRNGECLVQNLFTADDLPPPDRLILKKFVATPHEVDGPRLALLSQAQFLKKVFDLAYRGRATCAVFEQMALATILVPLQESSLH